ncbi:MAG: serine hydrolase domain-containing protein [Bacteroidales bacterium]
MVKFTFDKAGATKSDSISTLSERMIHYQVPAVNISVINNCEIGWSKAYGKLNVDKNIAANDSAIYQAGSVSKFVTTVILMHYVEQGLFDLDEDINKYLQSWQMPNNEFNVPVTLRQLLTHTSGLPGTNFGHNGNIQPTLPQILSAENPAINKPAIPIFKPGEKWSYSNIGYVVIQLVLEDVLNKSFDEIASDIIFKPLSMNLSTFNYPLPDQLKKYEALPHVNGKVMPVYQNTKARAQGGLMTTTTDFAKLIQEILLTYRGKSEKIISKNTLKTMLKDYAKIPDEAYGIPLKMGIGSMINISENTVSFLHNGYSYPGSVFLFIAYPASGQAAIVGINAPGGGQLELEIYTTLKRVCNWPGRELF